MMMRVLAAMLMPEVKLMMYKEYEAANLVANHYQPAPTGLLEVGRKQYLKPKWLRTEFKDNYLVKVLYEGLPYLPGHLDSDYTVVFMHRNPEEIKLSLQRVAQYFKDWEEKYSSKRPEDKPRIGGFDIYRNYNQDDIDHVLGILRTRSDIQLIEVQYEDFVTDLDNHVEDLAERLPTPILDTKIKEAKRQINPEYRRFRCAS
jgi:hypothetical protein